MGDQHVISITNQSHVAVINGCIELERERERETPKHYKGYGRTKYLLSVIHRSHGGQEINMCPN